MDINKSKGNVNKSQELIVTYYELRQRKNPLFRLKERKRGLNDSIIMDRYIPISGEISPDLLL
ncbi:hypothetical protein DFP95_105234 [Cohnella lupini]|uniref:Uncharacterized protein n=1 Tax=Cohnella lupini TaxID=1294267 RepID=A0A3D9IJC5_9BACL|nr:hypothetical protein DFP95_105234 [Cohnella lupini]